MESGVCWHGGSRLRATNAPRSRRRRHRPLGSMADEQFARQIHLGIYLVQVDPLKQWVFVDASERALEAQSSGADRLPCRSPGALRKPAQLQTFLWPT